MATTSTKIILSKFTLCQQKMFTGFTFCKFTQNTFCAFVQFHHVPNDCLHIKVPHHVGAVL